MSGLKVIFRLLKDTFSEWNEDKAPRLAAALAYYTAFSIAPLLIIVVSIAGIVFGDDAVQGHIQLQIQGLVGRQAAGAIQEMLVNFHRPDTGIIATLIGLVTLLLGAAGLFGQLQDALDTIWEVAPKPGQGILSIIRQRFISFTMVLGIGFLLLVSLVVSAAASAVGNLVTVQVAPPQFVLQLINFVISFGVITLLFSVIYKVLPDAQISWRDVWMGAAVTSLLFNIGKLLIGLYLGNSTIGTAYGAAGSFVVLLLWINYSAQILLFGAEFTQVYARTYGSRIIPSENAVKLSETDRIRQGIPRTKTVQKLAAPRTDTPEARQTMVEHQRLTPFEEPPPEPRLGMIVLGICAAVATFVLGMLISSDQKSTR
ncbi:MAG: YihY/virulence factor BrkB family protein [Anaerolineae bacterium]|nr:YihY/virulence factor BrkB family protein [Anaerolineae bacterium]